eukprot:scaffold133591_cov20-Tisochrysis_lutea.AAC.2
MHASRARTHTHTVLVGMQVIMLSGLGRVQDMCNDGGFNPTEEAFRTLDPEIQNARSYVRDGHLIPLSWLPGRPWATVPGNDGTGSGRDDKCGEWNQLPGSKHFRPFSDSRQFHAHMNADMDLRLPRQCGGQ